jgi:hypothetical protein
MINWIYTWYNPRLDGTAKDLASQMSAIILSGLGSGKIRKSRSTQSRRKPLSRTVRGRSRKRVRDLHRTGVITRSAKLSL